MTASAVTTPELAPRDRVPGSVWRIASVVILGAFMAGLDTSLVNVGLDTIARSLSASLAGTQWIASGYLLALAATLPLCGWLTRRFGASRTWLIAIGAFTAASALCAAARHSSILGTAVPPLSRWSSRSNGPSPVSLRALLRLRKARDGLRAGARGRA